MHRLTALTLFIAIGCATTKGPAPAPWSGATLAQSEVSPRFTEAWTAAENRETCALLAPRPSFIPEAATARTTYFAGGWAVAFDQPGLPGTTSAGNACDACGRSAFGIAGTGLEQTGDGFAYPWPNTIRWADGSEAGYGLEGGSGPRYLAYLKVPGQRCLYNVWSSVGSEHLESLLHSLRFVDASARPK